MTNLHQIAGNSVVGGNGDSRYTDYRKLWDKNPELSVLTPFPLFLDIEATNICNLRCPHCGSKANRSKGFIGLSLYKRIIDEGSENSLYGCKFHVGLKGEPLLHRQLPQMITYAKKKGLIDVYLNTNATLLTTEKVKELLDSGLDRISFSVDGYSKDYYESKRGGAVFEEVFNKILLFYYWRNVYNYKTKIRIQTIAFPDLNLEVYKRFWSSHADEVCFLDYRDITNRNNDLISSWKCPQLWQRMAIQYDGSVLLCNHDEREYGLIGYLENSSIRKLWDCSELNYVRGLHTVGNSHFLAACNGCSYRTSEIGKRIANSYF